MRKFKLTVNAIFATLFIAVAWFVGFNWKEVKTVFTNKTVYTQSQLEEQYNEGYNAGRVDGKTYITQLDYYKSIIADDEKQIQDLSNTIASLNANNSQYEQRLTDLTEQRDDLQAKVDALTTENSQLQGNNKENLQTIADLNSQIDALNKQISDMTADYQSAINRAEQLQKQVDDMQASIDYYEQFIANLEANEQVVATFEYDGAVYEVQTVTKGSTLTIANPVDTEYKIFNGWKVDDEMVDLATYTITTNTKFVADITYKYDVKFMVDTTEYNSQIITSGMYPALPTDPTKDGYEFDGWSTNGVDIVSGIGSTPITSTTTYVAVFTKLHTVTFMYDGDTVSTQSVRNGGYATVPEVSETIDNWAVNGDIADIESYTIYADTLFVAEFMWEVTSWNGYNEVCGADVWTDGVKTYYSSGTNQYVLNQETSTWVEKDWSGITYLNGRYIWTDGTNYYYSKGTDQYVLNKETNSWQRKTWTNLTDFDGNDVWVANGRVFYLYNRESYELDIETGTWNIKEWTLITLSGNTYQPNPQLMGYNIFQTSNNVFYFSGALRFKIDISTNTWYAIDNNVNTASGLNMWSANGVVYCTNGNNENYAIFNEETYMWEIKTGGLMTSFYGNNIWTDGVNTYYSNGTQHYKLCA